MVTSDWREPSAASPSRSALCSIPMATAHCRVPRSRAAHFHAVYGEYRVQIVIATLDNLIKGASGLAVQDMNLMLGFPETEGLMQLALFP